MAPAQICINKPPLKWKCLNSCKRRKPKRFDSAHHQSLYDVPLRSNDHTIDLFFMSRLYKKHSLERFSKPIRRGLVADISSNRTSRRAPGNVSSDVSGSTIKSRDNPEKVKNTDFMLGSLIKCEPVWQKIFTSLKSLAEKRAECFRW
jgi:hypothetical protein